MRSLIRFIAFWLVLPVLLAAAGGLLWLSRDAARPLDGWFDEREGELTAADESDLVMENGQRSSLVTLRSDSGLGTRVRVIRPDTIAGPLPVLVVLGGHRTGSDAAGLFGDVGRRVVVAMDYPYEGPERVSGVSEVLHAIPLARRAFRDTPPAVSLVVDWVGSEPWADPSQIVIVGASLGVPFATLAAARDPRISAAILVHGAANNLDWIEVQVARRNDTKLLQRPLATLVYWLAYGPTFDTARNVAEISPRPVVIIGAREDERTPAGQTQALYEAAGEPKLLRWTGGRHVQPNRPDVIAELLAIAEEVLPFDAAN